MNKICQKCKGKGKRFGLRFAGGSMGYGFPAAVGFALSKKLRGEEGKVFILLSDGECQIGTFYESLLIAKQHNLSNLVILVDNNRFCAMGLTKDILNIEPLDIRFKDFGLEIQRIDGHSFEDIENALNNVSETLPNMVICDTIKGYGVSKFEGDNTYHYKAPSEEEFNLALKELNAQ